MEKTLDPKDPDLKKLCVFAFDVISKKLIDEPKKLEFPEKFLPYEFPLFVTWQIGKEKDLRGCIGTFSKGPLEFTLDEFAQNAAFQDDRFPPMTKEELPHLSCGISLLTNFEKGKDAFDWEVGKHGIQIKLGYYRATFLPEVAPEQGWNKEKTLQQLLRKAGCYEKLSEVADSIELTRYQSIKIYMTYDEYQAAKKK